MVPPSSDRAVQARDLRTRKQCLVNFKIDAVFRLGQIAYGAGGNVSRRRTQKKKGCSNHFAASAIQVHSGLFQTEVV